MERSDGVKEYNPRDQNENERYNGKNVRAGADACADVKEHQQSERRADSNEPAPVATPVFPIHELTGLRHRGPEDLLAGIEQLGDFFEIHGLTPCGFFFYSILPGGIKRDKEKNKIRQDFVN